MSLAAAVRVAQKALAKATGETVTIQRGDLTTEDVPCGLGTSNFTTIDASGAIVTIRSQDLLMLAELYDFGDGPVEPARGDRITRSQADGDHTYELLDLPGNPSWRWSDAYQQRYRLHTKEVGKPT